MTSGPEQERQRLARLYSAMTSEEVGTWPLTEEISPTSRATTLKTEISRRALAITVNEGPPGEDVFEKRDLVSDSPVSGPARGATGQRQS